MVYLCGTKFDLVEENKKLRKVEYSNVKQYADGTCAVIYPVDIFSNADSPSTELCRYLSYCLAIIKLHSDHTLQLP